MEQWKTVDNANGMYLVSNTGYIKSLYSGKLLKPKVDKDGYLEVSLTINKRGHTKKIHRLVAIAFIENPHNFPQVNHKDEDKANNCVDNLEWCTHDYNLRYGTHCLKSGEKHRKQVKCIETNIVYPSVKFASKETNINKSAIANCARGIVKTAGKQTWIYV